MREATAANEEHVAVEEGAEDGAEAVVPAGAKEACVE